VRTGTHWRPVAAIDSDLLQLRFRPARITRSALLGEQAVAR
jgi:hypothetical protein